MSGLGIATPSGPPAHTVSRAGYPDIPRGPIRAAIGLVRRTGTARQFTIPRPPPGPAAFARAVLTGADGSPGHVASWHITLAVAQEVTRHMKFQDNRATPGRPRGAVGCAHFTRVIGAVHAGDVTVWASKSIASPGVENVVELVSVGILSAGQRIHPLRHPPRRLRRRAIFNITLTPSNPLVALLSMIGPKPTGDRSSTLPAIRSADCTRATSSRYRLERQLPEIISSRKEDDSRNPIANDVDTTVKTRSYTSQITTMLQRPAVTCEDRQLGRGRMSSDVAA